jgi:hypothetical protein
MCGLWKVENINRMVTLTTITIIKVELIFQILLLQFMLMLVTLVINSISNWDRRPLEHPFQPGSGI